MNTAYLANKATADKSTMNSAVYNGYLVNFTHETYYAIFLKAFNDLSAVGSDRALNGTNKINAFEQCLKDPQAIH